MRLILVSLLHFYFTLLIIVSSLAEDNFLKCFNFIFYFFTFISRRQSPLAAAWPCFGLTESHQANTGNIKKEQPEDTVYPQRDIE